MEFPLNLYRCQNAIRQWTYKGFYMMSELSGISIFFYMNASIWSPQDIGL